MGTDSPCWPQAGFANNTKIPSNSFSARVFMPVPPARQPLASAQTADSHLQWSTPLKQPPTFGVTQPPVAQYAVNTEAGSPETWVLALTFVAVSKARRFLRVGDQ